MAIATLFSHLGLTQGCRRASAHGLRRLSRRLQPLAITLAASLRPAGQALADPGATSSHATPAYELVSLARLVSDSPEAGGTDLTAAYELLEIFAGAPEATVVRVRHAGLTPAQHARLGGGERVVLLASRDSTESGRWAGPMPLRATDDVIDSFRRWSAHDQDEPDIPAAAPAPERSRSLASDQPADGPAMQPPVPAGAATARAPTAVAPTATGARVAHGGEPRDLTAVDRRSSDGESRPPASLQAGGPRVSGRAPAGVRACSEEDPPFSYSPQLQPHDGPGLLPAPPSAVLGPPLESRRDLRVPSRSR